MIGRLAIWILAIASIGVFVAVPIVVPGADSSYALLFGAATTSFTVVGLILIARVPGNRVGALLLLSGAIFAAVYALTAYAIVAGTSTPPWPTTALAWVVSDAIFIYPVVIVLTGIPLVFPDGHLISPRWRWFVWFVVVAMTAQTMSVALAPGPVGPDGLPNPLAVPALAGVLPILGGFSSLTSIVGFGGAAVAVWVRYRRGGPIERQQLKWLLVVSAVAAIAFPISFITPDPTINGIFFILGSLTLTALPIAIGIAILRYRLYEIDRIISRTIAYAAVTAILFVVFVGIIVLLQAVMAQFTHGQTIAVAASTLAVFALFQPVLRRVRRAVDRRFDRARYDAERMVAAYSQRLRNEVDIERVTTDLARTAAAALAPTTLTIWLRRNEIGGRAIAVTIPEHPSATVTST